MSQDIEINYLTRNKTSVKCLKGQGLSLSEATPALDYTDPKSVGDRCVRLELGLVGFLRKVVNYLTRNKVTIELLKSQGLSLIETTTSLQGAMPTQ